VSSTCLVAVTRHRYLAPCELARQRVSTCLYLNRVEIVTDEAVAASHEHFAHQSHIFSGGGVIGHRIGCSQYRARPQWIGASEHA
jgi:hypothetical protein